MSTQSVPKASLYYYNKSIWASVRESWFTLVSSPDVADPPEALLTL